MKTKKNTRYNPDKEGIFADILVVIFSLCVVGYTVFLFYQNLNKTFDRRDKPAIAVVSFKYKSVQRRFIDRAVWDRPVQYSPVYNGDTLRTAPDAEATVYFPDKSVITIDSNTMIQIFKPVSEDASVQIAEGKVSVQTAGAKMTVKSGGVSVSVQKDSVLHADKKTAVNMRLVVEKGTAAFTKSADTEGTVEPAVSELLTAGSVIAEPEAAFVSLISPASGARILNQNPGGEGIPLVFKWFSTLASDTDLVLETARSRDFQTDFQRFSLAGLEELTIQEESGTIYWRLYAADKGFDDPSSDSGKVTVMAAPPPVLLQPEREGRYGYRNRLPDIRFVWKGSEIVSSYTIEIADNPEMSNPVSVKQVNTESVAVSDLSEGKWYWRVTPAYFVSEDIPPVPSEVSFFSIEKKQVLDPIELIAPGQTADTAEGKSINFSWKNAEEVKTYTLRISRNEDMSDTAAEFSTERNYFELKKAAKTLPNGLYYWAVEGFDGENERITSSNISVFKTRDSEITLRSIFPPENYVLSDALCFDTRFTWKTNLDTEHLFQVSTSDDFSDLIINQKVQGSSIAGLSLKSGEYYWRVSVKTDFEEFNSGAKKIIIAEPLPKPELLEIKETMIIPSDAKNIFFWKEVPGVDYYRFKITRAQTDNEPVEDLFFTKNDIKLSLQSMTDGDYIISVQGFADSTLTSSRRYSYIESRNVAFKHLRPVELLWPVRNTKINGVQAALNPGVVKWSSADTPVNARLILEKAGKRGSVLSIANPGFTVRLPPLDPGTYRWRITAETKDGFDISSVKDAVFTVLPVEPLGQTSFIFPSRNEVLGVSFFKTNRSITFSWEKVRDATHYNIRLYNNKKQKLLEREIDASKCSFELTDLSLLSRGDFYMEVRALRRLKNGVLFQDGKESVCRFTIDLPKTDKIKTNDAGVLYGK